MKAGNLFGWAAVAGIAAFGGAQVVAGIQGWNDEQHELVIEQASIDGWDARRLSEGLEDVPACAAAYGADLQSPAISDADYRAPQDLSPWLYEVVAGASYDEGRKQAAEQDLAPSPLRQAIQAAVGAASQDSACAALVPADLFQDE